MRQHYRTIPERMTEMASVEAILALYKREEDESLAFLISFDIDGTMEFGDPAGGVTVQMVRRAKELGFIVGSCSDRFPSWQKKVWDSHGIAVDFWVPKHMLSDVKARFQADRYVHIGDRDIDRQLAEQVGFHFWWDHEAVTEPWLAWLTDQR
jgi:hypothetical protein